MHCFDCIFGGYIFGLNIMNTLVMQFVVKVEKKPANLWKMCQYVQEQGKEGLSLIQRWGIYEATRAAYRYNMAVIHLSWGMKNWLYFEWIICNKIPTNIWQSVKQPIFSGSAGMPEVMKEVGWLFPVRPARLSCAVGRLTGADIGGGKHGHHWAAHPGSSAQVYQCQLTNWRFKVPLVSVIFWPF